MGPVHWGAGHHADCKKFVVTSELRAGVESIRKKTLENENDHCQKQSLLPQSLLYLSHVFFIWANHDKLAEGRPGICLQNHLQKHPYQPSRRTLNSKMLQISCQQPTAGGSHTLAASYCAGFNKYRIQ